MPFSLTWEGNYVSQDRRNSDGRYPSSTNIIYNSNGIPTGDMPPASSRLPTHSLSPDQVKYMQRVTKVAKAQGQYNFYFRLGHSAGNVLIIDAFFVESKLRQLQELKMYEEPMFWCSQLFLSGWAPPSSPSPQESYNGGMNGGALLAVQ